MNTNTTEQPRQTEVTKQDTVCSLPIYRPAADVARGENGLVIEIDLPGISEQQVELELKNDQLVVKAQPNSCKTEADTEDTQDSAESQPLINLRKEVQRRRFERSFRLGNRVDREAIKASMKNGVLKVEIPYKAETLPRKINITAA